jgi:hypothetical protein
VIGGHFFFGEMEGLGEEPMARGVEGRTLFAFFGARAAGVFGVLAVSTETGFAGVALVVVMSGLLKR